MSRLLHSRTLGKALAESGFIPKDCRLMEIRIVPDGPLIIHYEVFVSQEDLAKLGDIFQQVARDAIAEGFAAPKDQP